MNFLEFIVGISWPLAVFLVLFLFRKPLNALLGRMRKLGSPNIGAEFEPSQQTKKDSKEGFVDNIVTKDKRFDDIMRVMDNPWVQERENTIEKEFESNNVKNDIDKINLLKKALAFNIFIRVFGDIALNIWGSQVRMLEYLNDFREIGRTKENLKIFYDEAKKSFPLYYNNYDFEEGYLAFLISWTLIYEKEEKIFITNYGVEFLSYLVRTKKGYLRFRAG